MLARWVSTGPLTDEQRGRDLCCRLTPSGQQRHLALPGETVHPDSAAPARACSSTCEKRFDLVGDGVHVAPRPMIGAPGNWTSDSTRNMVGQVVGMTHIDPAVPERCRIKVGTRTRGRTSRCSTHMFRRITCWAMAGWRPVGIPRPPCPVAGIVRPRPLFSGRPSPIHAGDGPFQLLDGRGRRDTPHPAVDAPMTRRG